MTWCTFDLPGSGRSAAGSAAGNFGAALGPVGELMKNTRRWTPGLSARRRTREIGPASTPSVLLANDRPCRRFWCVERGSRRSGNRSRQEAMMLGMKPVGVALRRQPVSASRTDKIIRSAMRTMRAGRGQAVRKPSKPWLNFRARRARRSQRGPGRAIPWGLTQRGHRRQRVAKREARLRRPRDRTANGDKCRGPPPRGRHNTEVSTRPIGSARRDFFIVRCRHRACLRADMFPGLATTMGIDGRCPPRAPARTGRELIESR